MATFSWIETAAVMCAILLGSAALASASWVWLTRRVFGRAGLSLSAAGVVLIGIAAWPAADQPLAGSGSSRGTAETLQPLEQKLGNLQQGFARLEAAMQAGPQSPTLPPGELKQIVERLETASARLAAAEALRSQIAELQEANKRQSAAMAEALADLGEQTRARLTALQVSVDRTPSATRPAAATPAPVAAPAAPPRPANGTSASATPSTPPGATSRTATTANASRSSPEQASAQPVRNVSSPAATPRRPPVLIEPAAGPAATGGSFWSARPDGRQLGAGTDGAEGPR